MKYVSCTQDRQENQLFTQCYQKNANTTNMIHFSQVSEYWVADLDLKTRDKAIIEKGRLLTDRHMHAAHKVLAEQFPHLQVWELLSQTGSFTPVSKGNGFLSKG